MALTTLLESQRDSSKLFQEDADHLVNFLDPKMWFSSDRNLLTDLKRQPAEQAPAFGQRISFEFQVSDVLNMAYVNFAMPGFETTGNVPIAYRPDVGMHLIQSYRVLWGNVQIHSVTNYTALMAVMMSQMDSDAAQLLSKCSSVAGAAGLVATSQNVCVPIPMFLDKLLKKTKAGEVLDLRGVSGRIRIELQLKTQSACANAATAIVASGNLGAELLYTSYVASTPGAPGNIVASVDFRENLVYKSLDVETTPDYAAVAGVPLTIDLTSYSGSKRLIGLRVNRAFAAPAAYDLPGAASAIQSEFPDSTVIVAAGRDYYRQDLGANQMRLNSWLAGACAARPLNDIGDAIESAVFPISVDQETKNYSGGINVTRISKTEVQVTCPAAATVSVVMFTDVLYELDNRQIVRKLQA